ncbi:MAG TPA: NAD(P)/FAD-dependent oxidoreductase [Candidatus Woesebacteria bacterium]|nr:NAD(P)/FAD-dependent oxidoreductase [Candidatus Woesebacteria bacterium]HPR99220.1 NAD(P)/FAD-dependent oxidoreductase [Candidatus Woesebacteria bacterium]
MKSKILVIGGGITGLVAAYRLLQKKYQVTLIEKSDDLGGLLGGFKINGVYLEKAYHHVFKTDREIISIIKELGLQNKLKWHESKTALYYEEKIYPFAGALDLLKFKPLSLIDKLRLGLTKIYLEKENNWQKFENVLAWEWMKKWCGDRAYEVVWEPLLKGKFSDRYKDISMAWMWARIHTRGNSSEKGREYLGYMDGGFQLIIDELERRIKKLGGKIEMRNEILNFRKLEKEYEKIISSAPLENVDYLGAITVVFSSKQSLSPYYWHNINDTKSSFLAFIQHTNLMGTENYGGKNIYYMGTYLPQNHKYFTCKDGLIERDFFDYLKKIFPEFNEKEIGEKFVFKFKYAQHIVETNYKKQITRNKKNGKIIQANFAMIYPEDRGINFAVREAEKVAKLFN